MMSAGLWAVVLSGGEGVRLRQLVRQATGDERPKQYAKLLGPRSLLRQTLDRVALGVPVHRTMVVTVRRHTTCIAEEFAGSSEPPYVLVQPEDRGTAAGILYAARWIARRDPAATVAIFPSDHFILGEATFMAHIAEVACAVQRQPDRVVLLGAQPTSPEAEDGWIEPAAPMDGHDEVIWTVRRFWENPSDEHAGLCLRAGCLWSTGVVVARAAALIRLGAEALPEMSARLAGIEPFLDSNEQGAAVRQAFALMSRTSFARAVLEPCPERLGVSRLPRVSWYGLGSPRRVFEVLARMRVRPTWADAQVPPGPAMAPPPMEPAAAAPSGASR
jgi:mannose-1-phosphate guanylyltransferase